MQAISVAARHRSCLRSLLCFGSFCPCGACSSHAACLVSVVSVRGVAVASWVLLSRASRCLPLLLCGTGFDAQRVIKRAFATPPNSLWRMGHPGLRMPMRLGCERDVVAAHSSSSRTKRVVCVCVCVVSHLLPRPSHKANTSRDASVDLPMSHGFRNDNSCFRLRLWLAAGLSGFHTALLHAG